MALNSRQVEFITKLKNFAIQIEQCVMQAQCLENCYNEEFADGFDNAFLDVNSELEAAYAFDSTDIKDSIQYSAHNIIEYWTGNSVPTYEYGQWLRRIK